MTGIAPLLVLGIGNPLLSDDGVGLRILEEVSADSYGWNSNIEFLDGGTQGMALLGRIAGRSALVILDAISLGARPGTIHTLSVDEILKLNQTRSLSPHEGGAPEVIKMAILLGDLPEHVAVIGVEPGKLNTDIGLSADAQNAVAETVKIAVETIGEMIKKISS